MKQIYLILFLLGFILSGWAQTLNESFDGATFPPAGWQNIQVLGSGLWKRVAAGVDPSCSPHSGAGMAEYNSYDYLARVNALLVSPPLTFTGSSVHVFSFWQYADSGWPIYDDSIGVYYNSAASLIGATWLATIPRYNPVDGWYKHSYLLPAGLTGINYLILRGYSQYGNNMFVDDVSLVVPPADDLSTMSINNEKYLTNTAPIIPSATIKNTGINTETGFHVICKIFNYANNEIYTDDQTVTSLASWDTAVVNFSSYTLPVAEAIYNVKIYTSLASDMDHSNDTLIKTVYTYTHNKQEVLLEIATGTWCQYCPGAAMGADDLVENGQQVAVVENHNGDAYAYTASNARNTYYHVSGFPTAIFDGIKQLAGGDHTVSLYPSYLPIYQSECAIKTAFGITIGEGYSSGNTYSVSVIVDRFGETPYANSNLVLQLALTQSHIMVNWQGQTHLEFVSRAMAPNASGTPIDLLNVNQVTVPLTFTYNPAWGGDLVTDYELVAWVQDLTTKEVIDAEKVNLQSILVGVKEHNNGQGGMRIYPNPVKNTLTVETLQSAVNSTLSVFNVSGQEVLIQKVVSAKTQLDMSSFAKGVYTLRLVNNDKVEVRKIVKE
ncbi:MAG: T9SS type A sorting domain-containing protein [Bacteroidetes bacterium]|nr:T9SS type A sorting domain-containing protein [Bacteroidota bacterium]